MADRLTYRTTGSLPLSKRGGREADIVIVDRFSGIFSDDDLATAMSRARRKPIVVSSQQTP